MNEPSGVTCPPGESGALRIREITCFGAVTTSAERKLAPCPPELGPHLRLQELDQPEGAAGHPPSSHRGPARSRSFPVCRYVCQCAQIVSTMRKIRKTSEM